jgi:dihydrolipoamide dehydrogenase
MAEPFDVVVIGAGRVPRPSARRSWVSRLRASTTGEDRRASPARRHSANVGCIPSKALLQSSENYEHAGHAFADHGIEVKGLALNLAQMLSRKDKVVRQNNDGIVYLFKKNKIAFFNGTGSFVAANGNAGWQIAVSGASNQTLAAKHVIIATGSKPRALPGAPFDNRFILDNEGALAIPEVPKTLGVVGAGVIGLEMGSVWRRLGAEVTVLEALPVFLSAADEQVAKEAWKLFAKQGLSIRLGCAIGKITVNKNVGVEYTDAEGKAQTATFDRLIVSIGRVPHTAGLNAESVGLTLDERGLSPSTSCAGLILPTSGP